MGPQQIGLLEHYAKHAPNSIYQGKPTGIAHMMADGVTGLSLTNPYDAVVVDSACSATQLATGVYARSEMVGLDYQGNPVETVLEKASKLGLSTGLISDTRATHATPAAFVAHQTTRNKENAIAEDLLVSGGDVVLSGGLRHFLPERVNHKDVFYYQLTRQTGGHIKIKSKRKDNKNLLAMAEQQGYQLVFDKNQLFNAKSDKVLGLFAYSAMNDGIMHSQTEFSPERKEPSLREMTVKALELLSANPQGFFLMIEGGQIDWAAHNNDAGTLLHEMIKFDQAIGAVFDWAKGRDDTLVVLTADHETGGFGISYSAHEIPEAKRLSGSAFEGEPYAPMFNFGQFALLDKLYQQRLSFYEMFSQYDALPSGEQSPHALMQIINQHSAFKVTEAEAAKVIAVNENAYHKEGHKYLSTKVTPHVHDFDAFYVYGTDDRGGILGRVLAKQQNTVWATGTHTHTPVTVTAMGPLVWTQQISKLQHHSEVGQFLMRAVESNQVGLQVSSKKR